MVDGSVIPLHVTLSQLKKKRVAFVVPDREKGGEKIVSGSVYIKAVRCGKKNCKSCPHRWYAYANYREGKKIKTKYLGRAK
jgi:hypothetical protein